ncbi:DNA-processing protein DprA [Pedobacter africanus]|uniref:DNA processing protein n=1 Tax=Pedobacter africanus TaxID=151894 RepID=A0A1W2DZ60_9SPHI|nr:DNA-processing protein DprA [Pedobacter africanus]SMD02627.1 DNA processing protein [Pedobacter africanus]
MSLIYNIALTLVKGVGDVIAKKLLDHFGTSEALFKASKRELMEIQGIGEVTAAEILNHKAALEAAEKQLAFIKKHKIQVFFYTDDNYPRRLKNCNDAPVVLYYKGTADLNHPRIISIVGTRRATEYGRKLCRELAETLAPYNVIIVSGMAYGIDVASHKESLALNIPTIGVMAHGLDRIYPPLHQPIAQKMVLNGGLLTEFLPGTVPDKENFPKRNRIIAGIADATIVVEATARGGALITADIANSYNRDVYAYPGRTSDQYSEGCNFLIKTNRAALIAHAKDLIYYLGWEEELPEKIGAQLQMAIDLSAEEHKIVGLLKEATLAVDEISTRSGLSQSRLAMQLLSLEMKGIVVSLPGKMYKLN